MHNAFANMAEHGTRFLVFGRRIAEEFVELSDLDLPAELASLCQPVPAEQFRNDTSSSSIRAQQTSDL